ncbi:MAG: FtsX-like permease family protein [Fimbriimonadaceae bacterium]|nr:FtsX-like permease family protein [Fimbriimonadaceae bacterium]
MRSKQDLFPLPDVYGIMYVKDSVLGPLLGKGGMINEVKVRVDGPEHLQTAMREAKSRLNVYRADEPVPRADLPSHQLLQQDIEGFKSYSILFPALFLSVAGLTFYTLLVRSVSQQRSIIGLLRAMGFGRGQVVRHYMAAGLAVGVLSSAIGTILGWFLGVWATGAYVSYGLLAIPYVVYEPESVTMALGFGLGVAVCLVASAAPARSAASVGPAEALRGQKPAGGRTLRLDRFLPGLRLLWRVPLRNVFRQPRRTLTTLFGIVAGMTLVLTAQGLLDSTSALIDSMLTGMFQDDLRVAFTKPADQTEVAQVRGWPGVVWAEGQLDVPLEFHRGGKSYSALLSGIPEGSRFRRLVDENKRPIFPLSPSDLHGTNRVENGFGTRSSSHATQPFGERGLGGEGLPGAIFGPTLRKRLNLEVGDMVELRLPKEATDLESSPKLVKVAGFNEESVGTVAYLPEREVWRLFHREFRWQPQAVAGIAVKVRPQDEPEIRRRLLALPAAAAVTSITDLRTMVNSLVELTRQFVLVMLAFGAALAFSIVYSMVSVNVIERTAEVATLRTLGFSKLEITAMVTLENVILALLGIAIGLPAGRAMTEAFLVVGQSAEQMDLFKMSVTINPSTYLLAAGLIFGVVLLAQIPALWSLNRIDLARAAKEQST